MVDELAFKASKVIITEAEHTVKEAGPAGTSEHAAREYDRTAERLLKEGLRITSDIVSDWGTVPSMRTDIEEDIET